MRITELFTAQSIALDEAQQDRSQIIDRLVELQATHGNIRDKEAYKKGLYEREDEGSTYVDNGITVPHAKCDCVTRPSLAALRLKTPVQYNAEDDGKTDLLFAIAAPKNGSLHVDMLARMMQMLMNEDFVEKLRTAKTPEDFLAAIDAQEEAQFGDESFTDQEIEQAGYRVLAVTACVNGIAHTYMAAEALNKAGAKMGVTIKVETNGSDGAKNLLTKDEIANCDGIIVAADKEVRMARFDGKPVIVTKVADGIHKPQELIEDIINGRAKVYHNDGKGEENAGIGDESLGRKLYKALMNGVSHMLPFVIGGGILIALSFLVDGANAGTAAFGSGTPLAKFFNTVGNTAFGMMFPILAGYIAMAIGDRPALMPGIVGGLLAKAGTSVFLAEDAWISSGFFGALIAGFAAGYLMIGLKKLFDKLPKTLEGTKPVLLYPFFGILIMAAFMIFIVNPPVGAFNTWLNNVLSGMGESSKMLLGAVLAGMMSIDFGGPFNKAAYVFGTASIASGQFDIMASVMIGGMVPPIAIALATTFFKNRFTKSEQQTSITNYIMGLSFITEGAIPFAASDPLRIIPPCIVGSAIAGALSMMFGCGSRAPHGGIFVIGIIDNPLMFLIALVVGAVVAMAGIVLLKKPLKAE